MKVDTRFASHVQGMPAFEIDSGHHGGHNHKRRKRARDHWKERVVRAFFHTSSLLQIQAVCRRLDRNTPDSVLCEIMHSRREAFVQKVLAEPSQETADLMLV